MSATPNRAPEKAVNPRMTSWIRHAVLSIYTSNGFSTKSFQPSSLLKLVHLEYDFFLDFNFMLVIVRTSPMNL